MTATTQTPFQFVAAAYIIRICRERARTLGDMARHLRSCSDASIFYHTFQSLESHQYTQFSSDFAQWIQAACNDAVLAEKLASVDIREITSIGDLRKRLAGTIEQHLAEHTGIADRPGFEPFHFCEAIELCLPLPTQASSLTDLAEGIRHISGQTLYYHFINSRLRLKLQTNDFSHWIKNSLGLSVLADRVNEIDFYTNTIEGLRTEILTSLQSAEAR